MEPRYKCDKLFREYCPFNATDPECNGLITVSSDMQIDCCDLSDKEQIAMIEAREKESEDFHNKASASEDPERFYRIYEFFVDYDDGDCIHGIEIERDRGYLLAMDLLFGDGLKGISNKDVAWFILHLHGNDISSDLFFEDDPGADKSICQGCMQPKYSCVC